MTIYIRNFPYLVKHEVESIGHPQSELAQREEHQIGTVEISNSVLKKLKCYPINKSRSFVHVEMHQYQTTTME